MFVSLRRKKIKNQRKPLFILLAVLLIILIFIFLRQRFIHPKENIITVVFPTVTLTLNQTSGQSRLTPTQTPTSTLIPIPTSTPTPSPIPTLTPTSTPTPIPTAFPVTPFESYFNQYSGQYQVSEELLKKIALCESRINPSAANGLYGGMYQFTTETWQVTRNQMGADSNPDLRFNAEESIKTAAFKIANGGQIAWKNCL